MFPFFFGIPRNPRLSSHFDSPECLLNLNLLIQVPLATLKCNPSGAPAILDAMIGMIEVEGIKHAETLWSASPPLNEVRVLQRMWARAGVASFPEGCDVRVVAGLLIVFLHELPESVITAEVYDCFLAVQDCHDTNTKVRNLRHLYKNLANVNRATLLRISTMLRRFADAGTPEKSLAGVFGPLLIRTPPSMGMIRYFALPSITGSMEDMIINHESIASGLISQRNNSEKIKKKPDLTMEVRSIDISTCNATTNIVPEI